MFYSDSWALISCQMGIYLTIYALNTLKIPDQMHHCRTECRTSSIILCSNTSCNILHICFNGSKMTTCLTNDQINNERKMSILSEETFFESGKLFKKNFQSRSLDTCAASSTLCPNFRGLFTSKVTWHVLHVKSKAQKVNCRLISGYVASLFDQENVIHCKYTPYQVLNHSNSSWVSFPRMRKSYLGLNLQITSEWRYFFFFVGTDMLLDIAVDQEYIFSGLHSRAWY